MSFKYIPPIYSGATISVAGRSGLVPIPLAGQQDYFLRGDGTWSGGLPLDVKASVRVTTTANIALSGAQTIDGVAVIAGDRVLVKDQTLGQNNGIYVAAAGAWSRATDADTSSEVTSGMFCFVSEGTVGNGNGYILTTADPIILGTTALTFTQFSGAGEIVAGNNISKSGNTISTTTTLLEGNGTVGAPAYSFTGDTNTGIYWPGADTLGVVLGGTEQFRFDTGIIQAKTSSFALKESSGNVFINHDSSTGETVIAATGTNQPVTITPSGTGNVQNIPGTVGAPSYSFQSDPDTGMYHPGANQIGFAVNGGKVVQLDSSGINIYDGAGVLGASMVGGASGGLSVTASGTNQSITLTPSGTAGVAITSSATDNNLSINTTGSQGYVYLRGSSTNKLYLGWDAGASYIFGAGSRPLAFGTGSTERMRLSSAGNLLLGGLTTDGTGVLQFPAATAAVGGITFGTDLQLYRQSAGGALAIDSPSASASRLNWRESGSTVFEAATNNGIMTMGTTTAAAWDLRYNSTAVFSLTSATNARINGTKTLSFGATAAATLGVDADTTAGNVVVTLPTTGQLQVVSGAANGIKLSRSGNNNNFINFSNNQNSSAIFGIDTSGWVFMDTSTSGKGITFQNGAEMARFAATTGNFQMIGTKTIGFGLTALATIGVSADTTAGVVTFTAPSSGSYSFDKLFTTYNGVATAGWGVPAIQANGTIAATTNGRSAAVATYTVGAADGTFVVSGNILVTTSTTFSFSLDCSYTDESNVARVLVLPLAQLAGTFVASGLATNVTGAGPYESASMTIRCKASTSITIRPSAGGTYTGVVYNVNANIRQVA